MATMQAVCSESDEDFHSIAGIPDDSRHAEAQHAIESDHEESLSPPEHPLKSMQGPFEESIVESNSNTQRPNSRANAELRRQRLLDATRFDESWNTRWKQRQDAQYHPLLKLVAQITFGMHLLQQNQAKNDAEVVKILQNHVDEVDSFLEQTAEDFDLAIRDIDERIRFLELPMQHVKVFNIMLDDKQFRSQLLDGNDKIERIIDRTARAMNAALLDVQKGRQATRELSKYLNNVQYTWPVEKTDLDAIYSAMRGNEEGWKKCFKDLQTKGNYLGNKLIELGTIIGEMSKMAATASRRIDPQNRARSPANPSSPSASILRSRFNPDVRASIQTPSPAKDKPLPYAPHTTAGADRTMSLGTRPKSFHQRFEKPREVPIPQNIKASAKERPKTSNGVRGEAGQPAAAFPARKPGPLSSHPPDTIRPQSAGNDRSNGHSKTRPAQPTTSKSTSQPVPTTKPNSHARAASAIESTPGKRDSFHSQSRDPAAGTSFARRWSIRKKHLGPTPEDYTPAPAMKKRDPAKTSAPSLKSPSQQRLATVIEASDATSKRSGTAPKIDIPVQKPPNMPPLPQEPKSTSAEAKAQAESIKSGKSKYRQSMMSSKTDTSGTKPDAQSITSSLKRRTLSIRRIFSRKDRAGAYTG